MSKRLISLVMLSMYAAVPLAAAVVVSRSGKPVELVLRDVALASIPMLLLAALTWRLVWPRWKLVAKLIVHPCIYALLSVYIGFWSVLVGWLHQGVFGLGGHIWFSRKYGFKWYAVEDPERYVALSRRMVTNLSKTGPADRHATD